MTRDNQELKELKAKVAELELEVNRLTEKRPERSNGQRFLIGFAIVFFVMFLSVGVLQFITQ